MAYNFIRPLSAATTNRYLNTGRLTLIPARYYIGSITNSAYHSVSGGTFYNSTYSISGVYWYSGAAGNYIEFGFKGPICGILFYQKIGKCDLIVDGLTIIDNLDISKLKGSGYNCSYVFKEDLTKDFHILRIKAETTDVRIVGLLADGRLNFFEHERFPLGKQRIMTPWNDYAAAAGATSSACYVPIGMILGVYTSVSAAADVSIQANTADGWITVKTYSFTAAGSTIDVFGYYPFDYIKFLVSAAVTITAEAWFKR